MLANESQARIGEAGWRRNLTPLKCRFLDWWNGHTCTEASLTRADADNAHGVSETDRTAAEEPPWSSAKLQTMELIWGDGFMIPGGERYARQLLAVLALSSKKSVLDLTAGIGGCARTVARRTSTSRRVTRSSSSSVSSTGEAG